MNDKNETDSISTIIPTANVGKSIVLAAQDKRRQRFQDKVIAIADAELEAISNAERRIEFYKTCVEHSRKRLALGMAETLATKIRGNW
jgi:hypothetical protein